MDFNSNQFTIFATSIIILILISFFAHHLFGLFKTTSDDSSEYRPVDLGDERVNNGISYSGKLDASEKGPADKGPDGIKSNNGDSGADSASGPSKKNKKCKKKVKRGTSDNVAAAPPGLGPDTVQYGNPAGITDGSKYSNDSKNAGSSKNQQGPNQQGPNQQGPDQQAPNAAQDKNGNYVGNGSQSALSASEYSKQETKTSFSTTLPSSVYLGNVRVLRKIPKGSKDNIKLDPLRVSLTVGMRLVIGKVNVTITRVNMENFWFSNNYDVSIDIPSPIDVEAESYLDVLSPSSTVLITPKSTSGDYSVYGKTPTPSGLTINLKPANPGTSYILHLPSATNSNNVLFITPSLNISSETLRLIAFQVTTTNEPQFIPESFDVIEGLDGPTASPSATPSTTPTASPSATPSTTLSARPSTTPSAGPSAASSVKKNDKLVTCGPRPSGAAVPNNNLSVFYVSDCVGYNVQWITYKLNTLIIKLDTTDSSMLYAGYYKLAI